MTHDTFAFFLIHSFLSAGFRLRQAFFSAICTYTNWYTTTQITAITNNSPSSNAQVGMAAAHITVKKSTAKCSPKAAAKCSFLPVFTALYTRIDNAICRAIALIRSTGAR